MKSIRSTFLTLILSAAFVIFLVQSIFSIMQFQKVVVEKVEENLRQVTREEAAKLNLRFATISKANETLAYNLSGLSWQNKWNVETIMEVIRRSIAKDDLIYGGGFWLEPYVYNSKTKYYGPYLHKEKDGYNLTWIYSNEQYDYFRYNWYKRGLESINKVMWSEPYLDWVTGVSMITSSSAIHRDQKVIGVTTMDVRVSQLDSYIKNIRVGKSGYALLMSSRGYIVGGRRVRGKIRSAVGEDLVSISPVPGGSGGVVRTTADGQPVFAASMLIGETGLRLVTVLPATEAYAPVMRVIATYTITLFLSLLFLSVLIWKIFYKKIDTPIRRLIEAITKVGHGELEEPILVRSEDELGMLAQAFEEMRQKLLTLVVQLKKTNEELAQTYEETIRAFYQAIMIRETNTAEHSLAVNRIAMAIGKNMGLSDQELQDLNWGTLLHDLGKLAISDMILLKPGSLDDVEYLTIRDHPQIGYDILKKTPYLLKTAEVVRYHHEKFDGSGYPLGLKGEEIPLLARICAVADAFQAMVADRPYRKGRPLEEAVKEIVACSGTYYDPEVVKAFLKLDLNQLISLDEDKTGKMEDDKKEQQDGKKEKDKDKKKKNKWKKDNKEGA